MIGNPSVIQRERLHASAEYIPEGMMPRDEEKVPTHMRNKYPK
jgi:hypothetical protein